MSQRLPEHIDPFRLAEPGRLLEGELAIARMARLLPALHSAEGTVAVRLEFGTDDSGVAYLRGSGRARLEVLCERCLQPMHLPIEVEFTLGLVSSPTQAERLPGEYEPLIVESRSVALTDVIEDELILALPIVAMHPLAVCPAADIASESKTTATEAERQASPFAVLADLKLKGK